MEKKVTCKSVLSDTKLYGLDYSVNPYTGCRHSCRYCYAVFMKKFTGHVEEWGEFVDVKENAPEVLEEEVKNKEPGRVLLSSVTDPYQSSEKKHRITRRLLEILQRKGFSVSILTKSSLVLRDIDILKKFEHGKLSVGFTINFSDDADRKIWEPGASTIQERKNALESLRSEGIPTYIHVGPWLEGITNLQRIMEETEDLIYEFQVENLNTRRKETILKVVMENYPELADRYRDILGGGKKHNKRLRRSVEKLREVSAVPVKLYID